MDQTSTFQVVGIKKDGTKSIICAGLTSIVRAQIVAEWLDQSAGLRAVMIRRGVPSDDEALTETDIPTFSPVPPKPR